MIKIPGYKILSHTADLRLEVYGKTLEELFINAAGALAQILSPKATKFEIKNQKSKIKIKVESSNKDTLLVDFLNEILARSNINKEVYKVHKVIKLKDDVIEAEIVGVPVKEFDEDVKAVTYHDLDITQKQIAMPTLPVRQAGGRQTNRKSQKIWYTKLVFDI